MEDLAEVKIDSGYASLPSHNLSARQQKKRRNVLRSTLGFVFIATATGLAFYFGEYQWLDRNPKVPVQLPVFFTVGVGAIATLIAEYFPVCGCGTKPKPLRPLTTAVNGYRRMVASDAKVNKRMIVQLLVLSVIAWMDFNQCFVSAWQIIGNNFDVEKIDSNFNVFLYALIGAGAGFIALNWGMSILRLHWCQQTHQKCFDDIIIDRQAMEVGYKKDLFFLQLELVGIREIDSPKQCEVLEQLNKQLIIQEGYIEKHIAQLRRYDESRQKMVQLNRRWSIKTMEKLIYGSLFAFRTIFIFADFLQNNSLALTHEIFQHGGAIAMFIYYLALNLMNAHMIEQREYDIEQKYRREVHNDLRTVKQSVYACLMILKQAHLPLPCQLRPHFTLDGLNVSEPAVMTSAVAQRTKQLDENIDRLLSHIDALQRHYAHFEKVTKQAIYFEAYRDIGLLKRALSNDYMPLAIRYSQHLTQRDAMATALA